MLPARRPLTRSRESEEFSFRGDDFNKRKVPFLRSEWGKEINRQRRALLSALTRYRTVHPHKCRSSRSSSRPSAA